MAYKPVAGDQYRTGKHRIGTIAIIDTALTIIAAVGVAYGVERRFNPTSIFITLIIFIIIGIIAHVLVGQPTQLNYFLGLSPKRFDAKTNSIIA